MTDNIALTPKNLRILALYDEPHRRYHTAHHVLELLELHSTGTTRGIHIPRYRRPAFPKLHVAALRDAIVAHDCVYQPDAPAGWNEGCSAGEYQKIVGRNNYASFVHTLIKATIDHIPITYPEHSLYPVECHFIDLDMAALAASPVEFARNSERLREEFSVFDDETYFAGRRKFLEKTLARPQIFFTEQFRQHAEENARMNILVALDELNKKGR